ncbi:protein phosphatase regulator [Malassezia yamatoensis]|uniref:Protein phosphatase regulator n=1 Tax=Malassezia yamatoensis TaxID=253288 RepID=A0AAJ5YU35_9BASI|nr:protein phosphatase regulator [Malassezia yamatoensis]
MDEAIAQFVNVTGVSSDVARTHVEASSGDVASALATFYEEDAAPNRGASNPVDESSVPSVSSSSSRTQAGSNVHSLGGAPVEDRSPWPSSTPAAPKTQSRPQARKGGIMSFNDLRRGAGDDQDEEQDRDPVNLFAGGERSGLNVERPDARRSGDRDENAIVNRILSKAAAATQGDPHARELDLQGGSSSGPSQAFTGRGHSIAGATVGDNPSHGVSPEEDAEEQDKEEPAVRHLTFWQDGFSIEDGPLMRYDDPANRETLEAINSGRAPLSLLNVRFGQPVELMVAQRTSEKYVAPPPPPMQPFGGSGNRLGAPSPSLSARKSSASAPTASTTEPSTGAPAAPQDAVPVDSSQPVTQIQVRTIDGQRLIAKLNHTHTIGDLRRYILSQRPEFASDPFVLITSFPPRPLTEETQSLADAQLLHSVVVMKSSGGR